MEPTEGPRPEANEAAEQQVRSAQEQEAEGAQERAPMGAADATFGPADDVEHTDEVAALDGAPPAESVEPTKPVEPAEPGAPTRPQEGPPPGPRILIDVAAGDLRIRGGAEAVTLHLRHERQREDLAQESGGLLRFDWLPDDAEVRVPDGAEVEVMRIEGDLDGRGLDGILIAHHVAGDANLYDMAAVDVVRVDGDLEARRGGALRVRRTGGDCNLQGLERVPLIGRVGGDLEASHLPGLELRESCGGSVSLDDCGDVSLLGTIGGDLQVENSVVSVSASAIGGDVELERVRTATLAAVGGDLEITSASGPIEVSSIGGDAELRATRGRVRLGTVGGDVEGQNLTGGFAIGRAGGDVSLDTALGAGAEYLIQASGDIDLRVRGEVNARFVAQTVGGEIRTRLPLAVEKGRRRNLVGVLGRGDATVTLRTTGGDISIAATDRFEEEQDMADEFAGRDEERTTDEKNERTWEGALGGRRFRVRWDRGPGRAGFHFQGPMAGEDPDGLGTTSRDFNFEWEKGHGARMSGEYEERLNELRDRAERVARRAGEEAQRYAEKAAKRARETDWEAVGREVRTTIEKAMGDLEETFTQFRRDWESRRPSGSAGGSTGSASRPGAQRVKIEYDDETTASGAGEAGASAAANQDAIEAQRRQVLEMLRSGALSLDEAERRLNELK